MLPLIYQMANAEKLKELSDEAHDFLQVGRTLSLVWMVKKRAWGGLELTATVLVRDFDDIPRAGTLTNLVTVAPSDMYECA